MTSYDVEGGTTSTEADPWMIEVQSLQTLKNISKSLQEAIKLREMPLVSASHQRERRVPLEEAPRAAETNA